MRLPEFQYFGPKSIEEAVSLLKKLGDEASILAGGTDLLVKMKQRRYVPGYVVNLKTVQGLDYIRFHENDGLRMGALTTIQSIKNSVVVKRNYKVLHEAAGLESSIQIRNRATIGGNIANASPAADAPLALITLNASVVVTGVDGDRVINLEDFYLGPGKTVLQPAEVIREVYVPPLPSNSGGAYTKHAWRRTDIAIVSAATVVTLENDTVKDIRIGLGSVAPTIIRAKKAEEVLRERKVTEELIEKVTDVAIKEARPIDDIRGYADYRLLALKGIVKVTVTNAIKDARLGGL